jgi:transducin (beta)-like 1
MDIDQNGDNPPYPSPKEVEEPPTPVLTKGPEEGTQFEKVTELNAETTFIDLSLGANSSNTTLLHCAWSPRDPQILATAGTDALGCLWSLARGAAATTETAATHVNGRVPPHVSLVSKTEPQRSDITAISWKHDGSSIALAVDRIAEEDTAIKICGTNGLHIHTFSGQSGPIICLRAHPVNELLVALMPDTNGTAVTVYSLSRGEFVSHVVEHSDQEQQLVDVAWTGDNAFVVCGGDKLLAFQVGDGSIAPFKKFETRENHGLVNVTYDPLSHLLATSSADGKIDVSSIPRALAAYTG